MVQMVTLLKRLRVVQERQLSDTPTPQPSVLEYTAPGAVVPLIKDTITARQQIGGMGTCLFTKLMTKCTFTKLLCEVGRKCRFLPRKWLSGATCGLRGMVYYKTV